MNTNIVTLSGIIVSAIVAGNTNRTYLEITNLGSNISYLAGGSVFTSGTGFPLLAGDTLIDTFYTGSYYGVTGTSGLTPISYIEEDN